MPGGTDVVVPASSDYLGLMTPSSLRRVRLALLVAFAACITLELQLWIGRSTIYRDELGPRIVASHDAIRANAPPDGKSWTAVGLNSTGIRLGAPLLAEGIRAATGMSIPKAYFVIDTAFLCLGLVLLALYLRGDVGDAAASVGVLLFAAVLPLTYQLFYFHPWDRIGLVSWIALLWLVRERRYLWAALLLPVAVFVKFDVVVLPGLVFLYGLVTERRLTRSTLVATAALGVSGFGTYLLLKALRPGSFEPFSMTAVMRENWAVFRESMLAYPPILAFAVPVLLVLVGRSALTAWGKACALFAGLLILYYVPKSMFVEFRAQVPVFLILLTPAVQAFRAIFADDAGRLAPSE